MQKKRFFYAILRIKYCKRKMESNMQIDSLVLQRQLEFEDKFLSPYACKSKETQGREKMEAPCPFRTAFQRDRDRILYCKSFLRLKNKTQVFFQPESDHYRTRMTHTLLVAQVARSIARTLSLNEDLAEAIALGHDLGHTPFGHAGERVLNKLMQENGGFEHNRQSLRNVEVLENDGKGLNLTFEVRDGIFHHKKTGKPTTLEGQAVSLADRIAYLTHDIDDAIRAGILDNAHLPQDVLQYFGSTTSQRVNNAILYIYEESRDKDFVRFPAEIEKAFNNLRTFMFEHVYQTKYTKEQEIKITKMLTALFEYYLDHIEAMPNLYQNIALQNKKVAVCDFIASMTDKYAVHIFKKVFIPKDWTLD